MTKPTAQAPAPDIERDIQEHSKGLMTALRRLAESGQAASLQKAIGALATELSVPIDAFSELIATADAAAKDSRRKIGDDLRQAATDAACAFEFRLPFVTFGCVTLHEKDVGVWELTILDKTVLRTLRTLRASELAAAALEQIVAIENVLQRSGDIGKEMATAYESFQRAGGGEEISPNLLMLLCSHGRDLRKHLALGSAPSPSLLSRPQMGFLLRRLVKDSTSQDKRWRLKPATIHVTKDSHRYVSVPKTEGPRQSGDSDPVAFVVRQSTTNPDD
jgi:hypothetical protein